MQITEEQKQIIQNLKSIDFTGLERTEELGRDYSFKVAVDYMKEIFADFSSVVDLYDVLRLPTETENQIFTIGNRLLKITEEIQNFVLKGNEANASSQHQSILTQVESLRQESLRILVPIIERVSIAKLNPKEVEKKLMMHYKQLKKLRQLKLMLKKQEKI